jgi:hypothetical protein
LAKLNTALAGLAALGLTISGPAAAATRAAQALPVASVQLDPTLLPRASAPLADANEMGRRGSPALILGLVALLALLIALAGGGGGGGTASPG